MPGSCDQKWSERNLQTPVLPASRSQGVAKSNELHAALAAHRLRQASTDALFSSAIQTHPPPTFLMSQPVLRPKRREGDHPFSERLSAN